MKIEYLRINMMWLYGVRQAIAPLAHDHDHWNDNVNDSGAPRAREAGASEAP